MQTEISTSFLVPSVLGAGADWCPPHGLGPIWDQWRPFEEEIDNLFGVATLAPHLSLAQPKPTSLAVQRSARSCATSEKCLCAACCALKSLCFPVDLFPLRPSSPIQQFVFFFQLRVFRATNNRETPLSTSRLLESGASLSDEEACWND